MTTYNRSLLKVYVKQCKTIQLFYVVVDVGFGTIQEAFKEVKHKESDMHSLMNTLLNEIGELRKEIMKVCELAFECFVREYCSGSGCYIRVVTNLQIRADKYHTK